MPSPFPGMDPYLEGFLWPDAHGSLIYTIRAALAARLPKGYFANIDQYLWLAEGDEEKRPTRRGKPDAFVSNGPTRDRPAGSVVTAEPTTRVRLPLPKRVRKKRYIRLIDTEDRRVVTVVELLSPSDKLPKQDRAHYLLKRNEYLGAGVNLVEIDLLRKGHRVPMGEPDPPDADYYLMVSKADEYPEAEVWAFTVREVIPVVPVPLRSGEAIALDLRGCLDKAYDESHYANQIDYTQPADPPLRKPDAEWAAELLKKHARKARK